MTTREELYRAAMTSTSDAERLVWADHLEQHGEVARAQVVHIQCELARLDRWDRRAVELRGALDAALAELGDAWKAELPELDGVEWLALERGLCTTIRVRDVATLGRHAAAIAKAAPVERVELATVAGELATPPTWLRVLRLPAGVDTPLMSHVQELELVGDHEELDALELKAKAPLSRLAVIGNSMVGRELAERLAGSKWGRRLQRLAMPSTWADDNSGYGNDPRLGPEGASSLAVLGGLVALDIDRHLIGSAELASLFGRLHGLRELSARECGWTHLDGLMDATGAPLAQLELARNAIGAAGTGWIAAAPRCQALQRLNLDTCELEATALAQLVSSTAWHELRSLDLSRNPIRAAGARVLARATAPAQLHSLHLADADLDAAAGSELANATWLGNLVVLDLSSNHLGEGATRLLRAIAPGTLRELGLAATGLGRSEAAALAAHWGSLVSVDLSHDPLGDAGIERFATRKAPTLQTLRLAECKLGDDGLSLLAEGARVPQLRVLDLSDNELGRDAVLALYASPTCAAVADLALARCKLDRDAILALAAASPPPRLRRLDLRGNKLDQRSLVALAESRALRGVQLRLDGNPWTFPGGVREQLAQRFGATWYQD